MPLLTHRRWTPFVFIAPALAWYAAFALTPVGESFRLSLYRWPSAVAEPGFVGLDNFARLAGDAVFWSALWHNVLLVVLSLAAQIPAAIALAVLLSYPLRARGLFRAVFFAPMVIPTVAIAVLWSYIYMPEYGLLDQVIRVFAPGFAGGWLSDSKTALLCVFVTICWRHTGFHMVLFMAGIAAIPDELYEAARLDTNNGWQIFRFVTLPLLRPILGITLLLRMIEAWKIIDVPFAFTKGGPGTATQTYTIYVWRQAFTSFDLGYASALGIIFLILVLIIVNLVLRFGGLRTSVFAE